MHRKLARKFAQDACDNSMKKMSELFSETAVGEFNLEEALREINEEAEQDHM